MKKEIELIANELDENSNKKKIQDENTRYQQRYMLGNTLTYGTPIQLKHIFSGKYVSLKMNNISIEAGSSLVCLSEPSEHSWFTLEPSEEQESSSAGLVVNLSDFFHIKSLSSKTPFFLHVYNL